MLTAADVEQKTFSTALRGYDLDEVDDFLDEVVATIRELHEMLDQAKASETIAAPAPEPEPESEPEAEAPASETTDKRAEAGIDESAVGRALIAAQAAADKLLEDAETQASRILEDAKEHADTWETEKEAKVAEAQAEMASLTQRVRSVRSELAVLAEEVSGKLDDMDSVIESGGADDADEDSSDDANQVTLLDTADSNEVSPDEVETGAEDTDTANGADHLDQILTGVAADLQFNESDEDDPGNDGDEIVEGSEESDEDEDE